MEHDLIDVLEGLYGSVRVRHDEKNIQAFSTYLNMIYKENNKFNLTGFSSIDDMAKHLIFDSLKPFWQLNVPRGTHIIDIGSGSGIPGIPMAIVHKDCKFTLVDSSEKRINFVNNAINQIGIDNAQGILSRVEVIGRDWFHREKYSIVLSRAMAKIYVVAELGSSLLKENGYLYVYSNKNNSILSVEEDRHVRAVGLKVASESQRKKLGISDDGFLFFKETSVKDIYPRKFPVIKREADKIY